MEREKDQDARLVTAPQYYYSPVMYSQDDEINLLDIWQTLAKRKVLIIVTCLLITLIGSAYAFLKPDVYTYSTAIQIGSLFVSGNEKPVDDAKNVASMIKEFHINSVLNDFYRENPDHKKNIVIDVAVPKDSQIVTISSKSSEQTAPIYQQLIDKISANAVNKLNEDIKKFRIQLSEQLVEAKKHLELLESEEQGLNKRIDDFDKTFKSAPINNSGTTVLVVTELASQQHRISSEKFSLQTQIANKEFDLGLTQDTKLLFPFTKSIEPVGIGKIPMVIISIFAGLFFGVIIALVVDQIEKIKANQT